jgi:hypothetical protein
MAEPEMDVRSRTLGPPGEKSDRERNQKYLKLLKALEDERLIMLDMWRSISDYILPSRGLYVSQGQRPHETSNPYKKILNASGTHALNLLGAGMQGGLTSPSRPWKKLATEDEGLMRYEPVAQWLDYVDALMDGVFRRSNFYEVIHQSYIDQAAFAVAVPFIEEDFKSLVRFYIPPIGTYCIASDETGRVETFVRRTWMTAINLEKKFGRGRLSDQVKNILKENPYKWFEVVHFIQPREERNIIFKDRFNMTYESVWFEYAKPDMTLFEGGFQEKPFAAGRWWANEPEVYGRSPGHMTLGAVKLLQSHESGSTKAMHKEVDPPMRVPFGYKDTLDQLPGGINYIATNDGKDAIGKLFDMRFDYVGIEAKIERLQLLIQKLFFNDLFFTIVTGKEMTATEVLQRHEEQLIMLGPTIERQTSEVLDPIIERVFMVMLRNGMIPPPPREMVDQSLKIDYVSTLAQAQKMLGLSNMRAFKQDALEVATVSDAGVIKVNWERYLDEEAFKLGVPASITRSDDEVAAIKEQQAAAAEQERQDALMQGAADDVKKLSQADTSGQNALTDIVEAVSE